MKFKYKILISVIIILAVITIINGYFYYTADIEKIRTYNSVNALIAFVALIVNIITIFFLYFNYQQQQKHINKQEEELKNNRKDVEFNRVIDLIYKQLEYTKKTMNNVHFSKDYNVIMTNLIIEDYLFNKELINNDNADNRKLQNVYFEVLQDEIKPYKTIINSCATLKIKEKKVIGEILSTNIDTRFGITIKRFIEVCEKYFQEKEFIERIDEDKEFRFKNLGIAKDIHSILYPTDN